MQYLRTTWAVPRTLPQAKQHLVQTPPPPPQRQRSRGQAAPAPPSVPLLLPPPSPPPLLPLSSALSRLAAAPAALRWLRGRVLCRGAAAAAAARGGGGRWEEVPGGC